MFVLVFVCMVFIIRTQAGNGDTGGQSDRAVERLLRELKNEISGKRSQESTSKWQLTKKGSVQVDEEIRKFKNDAKGAMVDNDKRDAVQLAEMVKHTTGTSPTRYLSYGCYCGFGGEGEPVDELDRCCLTHDRCYGQLTANHDCSEWWRYVNTYNWTISSSGNIVCFPDSDPCKEGQCLCDKQMAQCFQTHHTVYNDDYTGWWWTLFGEC